MLSTTPMRNLLLTLLAALCVIGVLVLTPRPAPTPPPTAPVVRDVRLGEGLAPLEVVDGRPRAPQPTRR